VHKPLLGAVLLLALARLSVALQEPTAGATGTVAGEVLLLLSDKTTAPGAEAVLWLPGAGTGRSAARLELAQKDKRFVPHVLAVQSGDAVTFPNLDRIYHNVFSLTPGHEFDLGLYHRGTAKSQRFNGGGVVQVYCNIHAQMAANVVVVGDGAFTTSGADGRFELRGVPAGAFPLRVWHERGGEDERQVVVRAGGTTSVQVVLDASRYKPVAHKNKHGRDYPPVALDDDRY
jgi:plastocyanin